MLRILPDQVSCDPHDTAAHGINTEVDFKQAAEWYEKAASKNHVEALMHLGMFYAQGKGVEKNGKKALEYIQKAAKTGDKNAQYNLARCYEEGIGTVVDFSRAFDYGCLPFA